MLYNPPTLRMNPKIETTNAGLKYEGTWKEICDFSRDLDSTFKKCVPNGDSIIEYEKWMPRENENGKMEKKTAEEAAMKTKRVEKEFNGTKQEIDDAKKKVKESIEDVKNGKNPGKDLKDASKHIEKLIGAKSVKSLRKMEEIIYEKIMLKFNPCYFDTEEFSVNLKEKGDNYVLTLNITDEEERQRIKRILTEDN